MLRSDIATSGSSGARDAALPPPLPPLPPLLPPLPPQLPPLPPQLPPLPPHYRRCHRTTATALPPLLPPLPQHYRRCHSTTAATTALPPLPQHYCRYHRITAAATALLPLPPHYRRYHRTTAARPARQSQSRTSRCRIHGCGCGNELTRGGGSDGKDTRGGGDYRPRRDRHRRTRGLAPRGGMEWGDLHFRSFARGVSVLQPLIGSLVECCSVLASVSLDLSIEIIVR